MVFVLGNLYFQSNRADDARRSFLEAIRRFPRFRRAHTNLAYLHISKNELTEALPMLQKAIELGENSSRAYGLLAYCHLNARNALAAENAYRQAYLLDPAARDWKIGLAQALMMQEKYPEAISLFGALIDENPNDRELWLQQTNAYLAIDRKEDAIVNLETLRLKGLARESELTLTGNLHLATEQPELALLAYLAAIESAKELDVPRAIKTAMILTDYGFPEKSEAMIAAIRQKAGDTLDTEAKTILLLAEVRSAASTGLDNRVASLLQNLTELNPADARVLLEVARHNDRLSRNETDEQKRAAFVAEAKTHYQLAAREPKSESAYPANLGLGQLLVREKRHAEALPFIQAAYDAKPSDSLNQYLSRVRRAADRQSDTKS
jgi:tetratricopeptide (TPR) repeat protein